MEPFEASSVKRLPNAIQSKWVEKVSSILAKDREPTFQDLASFVEARARVASSMYGRDFANANKSKPPEKQPQEARNKKEKQSKPSVSTLSTQVQKEPNAPKPKEQKEKPQAVAATPQKPSAAPERPPCVNCETPGHSIERCFKFKALSLQDKLQVYGIVTFALVASRLVMVR